MVARSTAMQSRQGNQPAMEVLDEAVHTHEQATQSQQLISVKWAKAAKKKKMDGHQLEADSCYS